MHGLTALSIAAGTRSSRPVAMPWEGPIDLSAEFSRFMAGLDGAPWQAQDRFVAGVARFVRPVQREAPHRVHPRGRLRAAQLPER